MNLNYNPLNQLSLNVTISGVLAIDLKQNKKIHARTLIQDKLESTYVFSIFFSTELSLIQVELCPCKFFLSRLFIGMGLHTK